MNSSACLLWDVKTDISYATTASPKSRNVRRVVAIANSTDVISAQLCSCARAIFPSLALSWSDCSLPLIIVNNCPKFYFFLFFFGFGIRLSAGKNLLLARGQVCSYNILIHSPPKNGLIALWPSTNGRIADFWYCLVVFRSLLRLLGNIEIH